MASMQSYHYVVVGDQTYECVECEGMLFSVTKDGVVAMVDLVKSSVIELDSESYFESSTGTDEHFVDVWTDLTAMLLHVSVALEERRIMAIDRYF